MKAVHTTGEEVGRVASKARVRTVVLSHLLNSRPGDGVTDAMWAADVRKTFDGEIIVGRDLMEI